MQLEDKKRAEEKAAEEKAALRQVAAATVEEAGLNTYPVLQGCLSD